MYRAINRITDFFGGQLPFRGQINRHGVYEATTPFDAYTAQCLPNGSIVSADSLPYRFAITATYRVLDYRHNSLFPRQPIDAPTRSQRIYRHPKIICLQAKIGSSFFYITSVSSIVFIVFIVSIASIITILSISSFPAIASIGERER